MTNSFSLKENHLFKEKYYYKTLASGFRITVIPKELPAVTAFLCCNFGGADVEYKVGEEIFSLPYGTAHFLEHKMFETADGSDAFLEFDRYGGNANAFTSYENTCYYFSCTENFTENLKVLLSAVSSIHCTDESVEKEKKIIAREITMYDDLPNSAVTRNLCKGMYHSHPTIQPILGTVDTISEITKETLFRAYDAFYVPENLSLCICGNVDLESVSALAEEYFGKAAAPRPETVFREEPTSVVTESITEKGIVASPLYTVGIKCPPYKKNDIEAQRRSTAMRLAISLTFGRASDFYCRNYEKGLINERFYAGYTYSRGAAYVVISGSGNEPYAVMEEALKEIEYRKNSFFTEEQILREKKAAYAESITLFDNSEDLAAAVAATAFLEYDEFDCIEILMDVTAEEIKAELSSIDLSNTVISIIQKGFEE